ncbi:MAG: Amidase enhancer precursor [Firmicutes bacterium ADurb.Bin248]|nr:MAG: Amidase enhancer precursor [Firmicutes bacterium ADurb.Bin248]
MRKLLCIILVFAFVLGALPAASLAQGDDEANGVYDPFDPENQDQGAAPEQRHSYDPQSSVKSFAAGGASDPRYVNVLLSQLDHAKAAVCFTGNYALCDASGTPVFQIESDYAYTISVSGALLELRAADGSLLHTGAGFYFKEYAPPAELEYNYFKVAQVSNGNDPSDRIYKGELHCYYQAKSGLYESLWAGLYLVNRIYIEEYLKGVLPAEIGDSPYAAALQAQAIVARNFAVQSKRTDGRVFDLYDYNRSQVYFGIYVFDSTTKAVNDTAGKLLVGSDSKPIRAYYCDSNGGYTETAKNEYNESGSGDERVQYDDFDLRAVRGTKYLEEVTIPATPIGSETEVRSLIANALVPALQATYPGLTADRVTITGISMANGACYSAACRHHSSTGPEHICTHFCSIDLTFSGVAIDGSGLLSPVVVNLKDIDFYIAPANGRPLGFFATGELSHYWLIPNYSATDSSVVVSYTIRHARHGSGVGLSQRGALLRAKEKQTLEEILGFYFPGCAVQSYSALGAADALASISGVTFQKTYDVLGHDAYVYAKSNLNSLILGVMGADSCALVASSNDAWVKISYGARDGFIQKAAFARVFTKIRITNVMKSINVRQAPNGTYIDTELAYPGETFELIEANSAAGWHKIRFNGAIRYMSARYSELLTAVAAGNEAHIQTHVVSVSVPTGYTDTKLWIDGVAYQGTLSGGVLSATIYTNAATNAVMYSYNAAGTPAGMSVWLLSFSGGAYAATKIDGLTDLLTYHGFSARIQGNSGIRFKSGISESTRNALLTTGIAGYALVEYGTVAFNYPQFYDSYPFIICQNNELPTGYGRSYWIENGVTKDFIVETVDGRIRFASVRINIGDENLDTDFIFRAYIKLTNGSNTIILYGAPMSRSIYTIAKFYMDRGDYTDDSPEGIFLNRIIEYVESHDKE